MWGGGRGRIAWAIGAAKQGSVQAVSSSTPMIGWPQLGTAFALVVYTSLMSLQFQSSTLRPLGFAMVRACGRCAAQLYLSGALLLTPLLAPSTPVWVVGAWLLLTGAIASREAAARVEYTYPQMTRHLFVALNGSLALVLMASLGLDIVSPVVPWYNPRTWIPIAGMLMGNAVTATALAAGTLTRELATKRAPLELQLARGATWKEALSPVILTVYSTALTPTINALCVTGVVHIPGLMTGQLLASRVMTPLQAAMYQILIFLLIAATVATSVQTLTQLALRSMVDPKVDRLRLVDESTGETLLQPKSSSEKKSLLSIVSSLSKLAIRRKASKRKNPNPNDVNNNQSATLEELEKGLLNGVPIGGARASSVTTRGAKQRKDNSIPKNESLTMPALVRYRNLGEDESPSSDSAPELVLSVENMKVDRTAVSISIDINFNDVIGIQGPSGIGKSQLLRTLAGLECLDRSSVSLYGQSAHKMAMADWRQKVAFVPQQQGSALEGTPLEFFDRAMSFNSQQPVTLVGKEAHRNAFMDFGTLLSQWNLSVDIVDQPWSTLSGGEAQRVSLAIAIVLQPAVLLLDECTSALDEETTLLVEDTLKSLQIPLVMVSHDKQQIQRLCNQVIDLVPAGPFSMRGFS
uniref:ABC transporter domain-containing protein n=1 Tax=Entomoneis paludosa TaxID=265537 RepID=A0A7S2YKE3_9STRA